MQASELSRDLPALLCEVTAAVREAGTVALQSFGKTIRSWIKGENSPVSEADIAVDRLLRERLAALRPDCGWLSEESVDDAARLQRPLVWIVDPIDGTRAFLAGEPDWSISVALVEHGRPVLGALLAPVPDELFLAVKGGGATRNGSPIRATDAAELAGACMAGPRRWLNQFSGLGQQLTKAPHVHSLALRLARVGQGKIDIATASDHAHDWDLAAADLLVHEAGGMLTTLAGETPVYNRAEPVHAALIAAGRARHQRLLEFIRDAARLGEGAGLSHT